MKSLLLVAHGSRRQQSNDEVRQLSDRLRKLGTGEFGLIGCAFLELAEPSIPNGIRAAIKTGAKEVTVLPYFLSAGRHVSEDIPNEVAIVQKEHPSIQIHLAPYLGSSQDIAQLLYQLASSR